MAASATHLRFFEGPLQAMLQGPTGPVAREVARRALFVESAAKQLTPVDTGRLRGSITMELTRDSKGVVAYVGTNVEYAIYVEMGTSRMRAQPYLIPALSRLPR